MTRMPVLFIGHGSPMNAIEENQYTRSWSKLAQELPKPKAILSISAHWVKEGTAVTAMTQPQTIHDFYGFPKALNDMQYPAPGSREVALRVQQLAKSVPVQLDSEWGLDHGTWSILVHMYPKADIPVLQLSIDATLSHQQMVALGKELAPLRDEGVLILGAGNVVHNLRMMHPAREHEWAKDFEHFVQATKGDATKLLQYTKEPAAKLAADEHFLPLLYAAGAAQGNAEFFNPGITLGSVSMLCAIYR